MNPNRRGFLRLLGTGATLLAAPPIVRAGSLMPVKMWTPSDWFLAKYVTDQYGDGRYDGVALKLWSGNMNGHTLHGPQSYTGEYGWEYSHAITYPTDYHAPRPTDEQLIERAKPYLQAWKRQLERDIGRDIALGQRRLSPHEFQKRAA